MHATSQSGFVSFDAWGNGSSLKSAGSSGFFSVFVHGVRGGGLMWSRRVPPSFGRRVVVGVEIYRWVVVKVV